MAAASGRPARLRGDCLEPRLLLSTSPLGDLTEGNSAEWATFASDVAPAWVSDETERVKVGNSSLKFHTESGFDTGVVYRVSGGGQWDLAGLNQLDFWAYAENDNQFGFQGNQPVIVLKGPGGSYRYEPAGQLMIDRAWRVFHVPLEGDGRWLRTVNGNPSFSEITQLEIHQDTWEFGFSVWYDGVEFVSRDPTALPPPGPPPPAGVNPDRIEPKVLLYVFDPIMENLGGVRQHEAYGWQDPLTLTSQIVSDFAASSHDVVHYQIVESVVADLHPYFASGFQHTDETFDRDWRERDFDPQSTFDYVRFVSENAIAPRVDRGEIDEVWVYAGPLGGMYESVMAGRGAYWINGPAQNVPSERAFVIMGWNFERGVGEAIHSFGHRAESIMDHSYGVQSPNMDNNWNRFTFQDRFAEGLGGVGNVHFPVNGTSDYDYANPQFVQSNADDWANYPDFRGTTRSINFREWSPAAADPQREYLNWWYSHVPHFAGRGTDYYLNNWWRYLTDVDQFKNWDGNLYLSRGLPSVAITTADTVMLGEALTITAEASVDGALGRVDLYIDGAYYASDTLAPYTFTWDAGALPGSHTLAAKAYELQNGTEAIDERSVAVLPYEALLVRKLYRQVLDREPEDRGLDYWTARLVAGEPMSVIAEGIFESDERLQPIISRYYQDYLFRPADPQGLTFWRDRVWKRDGGPENVLAGMIGSAEFFSSAGGTNSGWVTALYQRLLGRLPDQQGLGYWTGRLDAGTLTHVQVVFGFLQSEENVRALIRGWHLQYLNRLPNDAEEALYLASMQAGDSHRAVQIALIDSLEYRNSPMVGSASGT
ncbi:MAG: DUF4214 domain-containing protein [Pirellulales bacterium]